VAVGCTVIAAVGEGWRCLPGTVSRQGERDSRERHDSDVMAGSQRRQEGESVATECELTGVRRTASSAEAWSLGRSLVEQGESHRDERQYMDVLAGSQRSMDSGACERNVTVLRACPEEESSRKLAPIERAMNILRLA